MTNLIKNILSTLHIKDYIISASIGCAPEEQEYTQNISINISIKFSQLPQDCKTDKLSESYCYAEMTDLIKNICHKKHYRLIEHLAYTIFEEFKYKLNLTQTQNKLSVELIKLTPPVVGLKGGAAFCCQDSDFER